jgi:hypothetical protein
LASSSSSFGTATEEEEEEEEEEVEEVMSLPLMFVTRWRLLGTCNDFTISQNVPTFF